MVQIDVNVNYAEQSEVKNDLTGTYYASQLCCSI